MTNLKMNVEKIDGTIKMLKGATLCGEAEDIFAKYFSFSNKYRDFTQLFKRFNAREMMDLIWYGKQR